MGEHGGINIYIFVFNNSFSLFDPLGLKSNEKSDDKKCCYKVYLTFDDGPDYGTDDVLNCLSAKEVKATFFVNLERINNPKRWGEGRTRWNIKQLKRIISDEHLVGNHSYSHDYSMYKNPQNMIDDFQNNVENLKNILGESYSDSIEKYGRLPGANTWRAGDISQTDFIGKGKNRLNTGPTGDLGSRSGYSIFGWDVSWEKWIKDKTGDDIMVLRGSSNLATDIINKLENDLTKKKGKIVVLAHDRSFKSSDGNGTKVSEVIDILNNDEKLCFTYHTLADY